MNLSEAWVGFHFTLGLFPELIPNILKEVVQEQFIFQLRLTKSQSGRKPERERNKETEYMLDLFPFLRKYLWHRPNAAGENVSVRS